MSGPYDTEFFILGRLLNRISGSLSVLGSLYIIQSVLRDPKNRTKVANQVVVALSFADFFSSFFANILGQIPAPKGTAHGAIGNVGTCAATAFISHIAFVSSTYYNASLALVYLLVIKYGWKEEKLQKVRIYLFLIPLLLTLPFAITNSALGGGNFQGTFCSNVMPGPAYCTIDVSIPCERGENFAEMILYRMASATLQTVISFPIIIGCMGLLYLSILKIEKKNDRYRFDGELNREQSKRIAIQGIYYVWAFLIVEATWCVAVIMGIVNMDKSGNAYRKITASAQFVVPLQGFLNALVYLRPSYLEYLRNNPEKTIPNRIRLLFGLEIRLPEKNNNITTFISSRNISKSNYYFNNHMYGGSKTSGVGPVAISSLDSSARSSVADTYHNHTQGNIRISSPTTGMTAEAHSNVATIPTDPLATNFNNENKQHGKRDLPKEDNQAFPPQNHPSTSFSLPPFSSPPTLGKETDFTGRVTYLSSDDSDDDFGNGINNNDDDDNKGSSILDFQ